MPSPITPPITPCCGRRSPRADAPTRRLDVRYGVSDRLDRGRAARPGRDRRARGRDHRLARALRRAARTCAAVAVLAYRAFSTGLPLALGAMRPSASSACGYPLPRGHPKMERRTPSASIPSVLLVDRRAYGRTLPHKHRSKSGSRPKRTEGVEAGVVFVQRRLAAGPCVTGVLPHGPSDEIFWGRIYYSS